MDLVLDIGNFRLKGAFFEGDHIVDSFVIQPDIEQLNTVFNNRVANRCMISSSNSALHSAVEGLLREYDIAYSFLDYRQVKVKLDVDEPEQVGPDRIANVYGALFHFPQNDCIVVDLGTAITFDYIGCDGRYLGGAIYPGIDIGAKALDMYTEKLPEVKIEKPPFPLAKTTVTHIQSGLYYGLLGAIERITFELRKSSPSPSDVKIIACGGLLRQLGPESFSEDVSELVDLIDPQLTLIGIHEIMKEK